MSGSEVGLICGVAIFLFPDPMLSGICFTDFILLSDAKTIRRDFGKQTIPIRQYRFVCTPNYVQNKALKIKAGMSKSTIHMRLSNVNIYKYSPE